MPRVFIKEISGELRSLLEYEYNFDFETKIKKNHYLGRLLAYKDSGLYLVVLDDSIDAGWEIEEMDSEVYDILPKKIRKEVQWKKFWWTETSTVYISPSYLMNTE